MQAMMRVVGGAILAVASLGTVALGSGSEGFGNDPLPSRAMVPEALQPLAERNSRVYWREVNGDVHLFFRGDVASQNAAIAAFATAEPAGELVVRPGPGRTESFEGKAVPHDVALHVPGGIGFRMLASAKTPEGTPVFDARPTLTVFVADADAPAKLVIPKGLHLVELSDLRQRFEAGLKTLGEPRTATVTARAQSAVALGELDAIAGEVVPALRAALKDGELYVRLCAISALGRLGTPAKAAIPDLEAARTASKEDREKDAITQAIDALSKTTSGPDDRTRSVLAAIHRVRLGR